MLLDFIKKKYLSRKKSQKNKKKRNKDRFKNKRLPFYFLFFIAPVFLIAYGFFFHKEENSSFHNKFSNRFHKFVERIGLKVEEVFIEGRHHTSYKEINDIICVSRGDSILKHDVHKLFKQLSSLNWIKYVTVQRRFPGVLYIKIQERTPIAMWKHQNRTYLIDTEGVSIKEKNITPFMHLPAVVGSYAPSKTPGILSILKKFPLIYPHVTSLVHVRKRRWNIFVHQGLCIKLPENNIEESLKKASEFLSRSKIPLSNMRLIDLRVEKRIILSTSPETIIKLKTRGGEET